MAKPLESLLAGYIAGGLTETFAAKTANLKGQHPVIEVEGMGEWFEVEVRQKMPDDKHEPIANEGRNSIPQSHRGEGKNYVD